ncbi:MAG: hypothetical protein O2968_18900 [Acidobacteria bacterium]|nr:hypothetical protein [Acidobacteriota bacterium]
MENALIRIAAEGHQHGTLLEGFLKTMRGMLSSGHRPQNYLLVCLTDGRTKAAAVADAWAAAEHFTCLRNEYGPVRNAFFLEVSGDATEPTLCIRDLAVTGAPSVRQKAHFHAGVLAFDTPTWERPETVHSRDCKNAAIFPGSFGITTGWLPNVDSIFSPPGVAS